MPMCNFKDYSDNYAKRSGSLWQCSKHEPDDGGIIDSESFTFNLRNTNNAGNVSTVS